MLGRFRFALSVVFFITLTLMVSCRKDNAQANVSLFNHWKFVGFIDAQNKLTKYSLHTDCDSCISLFLSNPDKYYGRLYFNGLARYMDTIDNSIILKPLPSNTFDILFPEGKIESKFFDGISTPDTWKISNNHLYLSTTAYSDKVLFIKQ